MMSFGQAIKIGFKKYFTVSGRASRAEFWWFTLFNIFLFILLIFVVYPCLVLITEGISSSAPQASPISPSGSQTSYWLMMSIIFFALALFPANLCVTIRRLHDTGRSGWNLLCLLFPDINIIFLIFLFFYTIQKGDDGENKYGGSPLLNSELETKYMNTAACIKSQSSNQDTKVEDVEVIEAIDVEL